MSASVKESVLASVVNGMLVREACEKVADWKNDPKIGITSISHDSPDYPLWDVQMKIRRNIHTVNEMEGLISSFAMVSQCANQRHLVIDLVAHSTSKDQVLVFDGWEVRDEERNGRNLLRELCRQIKPLLKGVHLIRLIGCATANTEAGMQAMRAIQEETGVRTLGTGTDIDLYSFSDTQCVDTFLRGVPGGVPDRGEELAVMRSPQVPELVIEDPLECLLGPHWPVQGWPVRRLWRSLSPFLGKTGWHRPGLLLEPLLTAYVPLEPALEERDRRDELDLRSPRSASARSQGGGTTMKIDVLYDWKYLRLWPTDVGLRPSSPDFGRWPAVIVEIQHAGAVRQVLDSERAQVRLPTRR
jgi:hypothetical protein